MGKTDDKDHPYCYKVLNDSGFYESWTGSFKTKKAALIWYDHYGKFHEERGHKIALFHKSIIVKS